MHRPSLLAAVATTLILALPATAIADQPLAPHLSTKPALRTSTAELRQGMEEFRAQVLVAQEQKEQNALDEAGYLRLATEFSDLLTRISTSQDLHSQSDRHLQWLLGDIAESIAMMKSSPRLPVKQLSLKRIAETLNLYGREYDHPGWQPILSK